jgi:surface polysaccharide O-acyltransferase-like enzyme
MEIDDRLFLNRRFFEKVRLTHLWFLHQLLVIYLLLLGARWLVDAVRCHWKQNYSMR